MIRNSIFVFLVLMVSSLNAQTFAYKCVDVDDSKYWNYFNIDFESLHFQIGKQMKIFYYKNTKDSYETKKFVFSDNQYTFTVIKKRNDFKNLIITDGQYTYDCKFETVVNDMNKKTPIILE